MGGPLDGVFQRAVAFHQLDCLAQIVIDLLLFFQCAAPERPFGLVAAQEGKDDGKGDFAFTEIVSDRFAELFLACGIIQRIVDQLKGDAEIHAVGTEGFMFLLRPVGYHGTDFASGSKKGGGLALDHFQIGLFRGCGIVAGHQL